MNKRVLMLVVLMLGGAVAACSLIGPWDLVEDISTPGDSIAEEQLYDAPEDCFEGETYDPVERLCYVEIECETDQECEDLLDEIYGSIEDLDQDIDSIKPNPGSDDYADQEDGTLVTYEVQGNQIANPQMADVPEDLLAYQNDTELHQRIWSYFASLIPMDYRTSVSQFIVFTDGVEETMAAVEPDPDDPAYWILVVDVVDAANPEELTHTLIHEFGHILTLDSNQVPPDRELLENPEDEQAYEQAADACPNYFPGEGCSLTTSYINLFFDRFWVGDFETWLEIESIEDDDEYYEALDQFYLSRSDQFVSDYAATNPGEDIAESWTYFVLQEMPSGASVANEKIRFFYEFDDLVQLRLQILSRTLSRLRRNVK